MLCLFADAIASVVSVWKTKLHFDLDGSFHHYSSLRQLVSQMLFTSQFVKHSFIRRSRSKNSAHFSLSRWVAQDGKCALELNSGLSLRQRVWSTPLRCALIHINILIFSLWQRWETTNHNARAELSRLSERVWCFKQRKSHRRAGLCVCVAWLKK